MELVPDSELVGRVVMVVWHSGTAPEVLQPAVERLRDRVGERGRVALENADRLEAVPQEGSSVDVVVSGLLPPHSSTHPPSLLAELARVLRPSGLLFLREPVTTSGAVEGIRPTKKLSSALKLSGFVDVSEVEVVEESGLRDNLKRNGSTLTGEDSVSLAFVRAKKPSYEVGVSASLSFANCLPNQSQNSHKVSEETVRVWSLDPTDDDVDLLDSDTLLEEEDLIRPDPASLKSTCGPNSGRKKACKDCTCGLREELEGGKPATGNNRTVTSSCGSCYLGDAFRCASCPYLGMPAFKPGEQIRLSNRQLKADQ